MKMVMMTMEQLRISLVGLKHDHYAEGVAPRSPGLRSYPGFGLDVFQRFHGLIRKAV
jgi:hypothetical protein